MSQVINEPGPKLEAQRVTQFEELIGSRLPEPYRSFLLQHNGGRPSRSVFVVPEHPEREFEVHYFHGLGRSSPTSNLDWWWNELPLGRETGIVVVAGTGNGDEVLLDYSDGSVYFWDSLAADHERKRFPIAKSFGEFLEGLREDADSDSNSNDKAKLKKAWRAQQRAAARAGLPLPEAEMRALFDHLDVALGDTACDHTLRLTLAWLAPWVESPDAVVAWLRANGGYCDCEALANAEEGFVEIFGS